METFSFGSCLADVHRDTSLCAKGSDLVWMYLWCLWCGLGDIGCRHHGGFVGLSVAEPVASEVLVASTSLPIRYFS